jgi:hypothetical protein
MDTGFFRVSLAVVAEACGRTPRAPKKKPSQETFPERADSIDLGCFAETRQPMFFYDCRSVINADRVDVATTGQDCPAPAIPMC